ncbi:hypothetical protein GOQ27_10535 [Clostridium sp. D2Q-11]|uniref:Uncharacterized protein n=1 Tax=Anaeromonas frigoriresistens TaxID=2683708 RepID=A0A942UTE9_9FIRM|nr:hypothetical protein [Anaeromonas frigoriresistens]MBS4538904.1 hypothetical protein [Anaeromonas frigoriresistens]
MKRTIIITLVLIMLLNISGCTYLKDKLTSSDKYTEEELQENLDKQQEVLMNLKEDNDIEDISMLISTSHDKLNNSIGWNRKPKDYNQFKRLGVKLEDAAQSIADRELKNDLIIASKLLKKGEIKKDREMIIYAHRILHDLDSFLFSDKPKDNFKSTEKLTGKNKYSSLVE